MSSFLRLVLVYGRRPTGSSRGREAHVERTAMWLFSALFFVSLPIWGILTIVLLFNSSSGTGKADGVFAVLLLVGLLGMVGVNILERYAALKGRRSDQLP